jgi:hypothetical protein
MGIYIYSSCRSEYTDIGHVNPQYIYNHNYDYITVCATASTTTTTTTTTTFNHLSYEGGYPS